MNAATKEKPRLLIVDDSKLVRVTARKILSDHFETVEAVDGEEAWNILAEKETFSLVISDLSMPNLDGFDLLARIRNFHLAHIRDLPVIVITGANDSEATKERATLAGATDFIGKPFDSVHLLARTQAHASAHAAARKLRDESFALEDKSFTDAQTRLANESAFMDLGYQQLAYAVRHNTQLSVFYIEVDRFDELFRQYGDSVAESIVLTVATVLSATIRHEDTAARIGSARFALLLPGLNNNGVHNLASRVMKNLSERVLKHGDTRTHFTASIGIAATEICRNTRFDDMLSRASTNLSYAIECGGNRVVHKRTRQGCVPQKEDTANTNNLIENNDLAPDPTAFRAGPGSAEPVNTACEEAIEITTDSNPYSAQFSAEAKFIDVAATNTPTTRNARDNSTTVAHRPAPSRQAAVSRKTRDGAFKRVLGRLGSLFRKS